LPLEDFQAANGRPRERKPNQGKNAASGLINCTKTAPDPILLAITVLSLC
jgi:hypothetical protein